MAIVDLDKRENQDDSESSAPQKSLYGRLKKLFSTDVIVRNVGGKKLKVMDTDGIQRGTDKNSLRDKFNRVRSTSAMSNRDMNMSYQAARLELFRDYDVMDNDSIIAAALDVYADESTTKNEMGDILTIRCDDENIKQILHNLFYDILNIDFNLWSWVRNMCKYGDFYLKLDITPEYGIYNVAPISAYEMNRVENSDPNNPNYVKFQHEGAYGGGEYENYEVAHFRLISDANFLPYGKSMIEGARRVWKQLTLMEDGMLIHRIMRAPEKRVFKVDVGNIPPAEVDTYMEKMMAKIKKIPYIDERTGDYNLRFNLQNMVEDFYLPVRGGDSGTSIDTLSGMEFTGIEDIEYLRNKMLAALKIPKAFLGFDEAVAGRATLSAQDIRFARTITRIQQIIVSELNKIATIHLFSQGFQDASLVSFSLELTNPSTVFEQEKVALWADKISLAKDMMESKLFSSRWIYDNIFEISDADQNELYKGVIWDTKQRYRQSQIETAGNDPQTSGQKVNEDGQSEGSEMDYGGSFSGGNHDDDAGGDASGDDNGGGNNNGGGDQSGGGGGDMGNSDSVGLNEEHHAIDDPTTEREQRAKDADKKVDAMKGRGQVEDPLGKLELKSALKIPKRTSKSRPFQSLAAKNDLKRLKERLKLGTPKGALLTEVEKIDFVEPKQGKPNFMNESNILED
jgi:hypothetical protein